MSGDPPAPRLYLATPPDLKPADFAPRLAGVLDAVAIACVRLDLGPQASENDWMRAVNHLLEVCHGADVPLVVTDHFRLVAPLGLDGVHLAASQTPLREVRKVLGPDRIIGAHAGAARHRGLVLAEAGADYVSFGPVGASGALGDDTRANDEVFAWWSEMIETPVVAEGGTAPEDARRLSATADFVVPDPGIWTDPARTIVLLRDYVEALTP